jgi:SAM-dependent methyltransferase
MYKLDWVSAEDDMNREKLENLSNRLISFYSQKSAYYDYIQEFGDVWNYDDYIPCERIRYLSTNAGKVLEIGCGKANILVKNEELQKKYHGVEFSNEIIESNKARFPNACFKKITNPYVYDFADGEFDVIFSVFVLEHAVFPNLFLNECLRLLKKGGRLIILAPNFLDNNWVVSQRVASNLKSGLQNFKSGQIINAFTSLLYRRSLIPQKCQQLRKGSGRFWINCDPACFYFDETIPDLDAVHITSFSEIMSYLEEKGVKVLPNEDSLQEFIQSRRLGFLEAIKE